MREALLGRNLSPTFSLAQSGGVGVRWAHCPDAPEQESPWAAGPSVELNRWAILLGPFVGTQSSWSARIRPRFRQATCRRLMRKASGNSPGAAGRGPALATLRPSGQSGDKSPHSRFVAPAQRFSSWQLPHSFSGLRARRRTAARRRARPVSGATVRAGLEGAGSAS
jgi:hypothetical protein